MLQLPVEMAYPKACQIIGEQFISNKFLCDTVASQAARIQELEQQLKIATESGFVIQEAKEIVEGADAPDHREG